MYQVFKNIKSCIINININNIYQFINCAALRSCRDLLDDSLLIVIIIMLSLSKCGLSEYAEKKTFFLY